MTALTDQSLDVLDSLATHGAMRRNELLSDTGRDPDQVSHLLRRLRLRGLVDADPGAGRRGSRGCGAVYWITVAGFLRLERKGVAA